MKSIDIQVENPERFSIAFIGDVQYGNPGFSDGAWARAKNAIESVAQYGGAPIFIVGTGDYIDFMSPSNRAGYKASGIYSSSTRLIDKMVGLALTEQVAAMFEQLHGKWVVLLQGHHWADIVVEYSENTEDGEDRREHSDRFLAGKLGAEFAPHAALINFRLPNGRVFRLLANHGAGGGQTLTYALNKLIKKSGGWEGIDAYAMGHTHALAGVGVPKLRWDDEIQDLVARNVPIINTGSFLKGIAKNVTLYPEEKDYNSIDRAMGIPILTVTPPVGKRDFGLQLSLFW